MEKDNLPEVTGGSEKFEEHPIRLVCGFWRRLFAFIVDGILLGIFGIIIGTIFFDFFAGLGG